MNTIKFVTYYNNSNDTLQRTGSPAANNVINYIIKIVAQCGETVDIISPSWVISNGTQLFIASKRSKLSESVNLITAPSFIGNNKAIVLLKKLLSRVWLISYLLFHIKRNEKIMVYHQPTLMMPIRFVSTFKKIRVLMIDEELYSDIKPKFNHLSAEKELGYLRKSNSFIFPTRLLMEKVNTSKNPYAIIHGTYNVEYDRNCKFGDGKTHVVYAGTFNPLKGGAAAAAAAAFLDSTYHIHIIGFGSDCERNKILDTIKQVSSTTECELTYDGLKSGEDYIRFLQSCDIGLSTQNPTASFNDTSFPSKILSYLSNGLKVVSIRIPAVETSDVSSELFYYDEQTPQNIASAIISATHALLDSRKAISELNEKAVEAIERLLKA